MGRHSWVTRSECTGPWTRRALSHSTKNILINHQYARMYPYRDLNVWRRLKSQIYLFFGLTLLMINVKLGEERSCEVI